MGKQSHSEMVLSTEEKFMVKSGMVPALLQSSWEDGWNQFLFSTDTALPA